MGPEWKSMTEKLAPFFPTWKFVLCTSIFCHYFSWYSLQSVQCMVRLHVFEVLFSLSSIRPCLIYYQLVVPSIIGSRHPVAFTFLFHGFQLSIKFRQLFYRTTKRAGTKTRGRVILPPNRETRQGPTLTPNSSAICGCVRARRKKIRKVGKTAKKTFDRLTPLEIFTHHPSLILEGKSGKEHPSFFFLEGAAFLEMQWIAYSRIPMLYNRVRNCGQLAWHCLTLA